MNVNIIQVEYDKLDDIAGRFAKHAESMVDMRSRIENGVQALQSSKWEGQSSAAFFTEMDRDVFPVMTRLANALEQAQSVTSQAKDILQAAEEEAKRPFQITVAGFLNNPANNISESNAVNHPKEEDDGGFFGWLGDKASAVGDFIVDHRDEVALGGALVAAGIAAAIAATVATGGLAAPIIAGAVVAGGITLAINAASSKYPLMDGVLGNTISGGFIGWGVGSVATAIGTLSGISTATPWAASVGGAAAQWSGSAGVALPIARIMTFAPPALELISGGSMVVSSGGFDWAIGEQYESTVHTVSNYIGMGSAGLNLASSVAGNALIKRAFSNPLSFPPGGRLTGAGNSTMFQGHHLNPQKELGRLNFPGSVLDDAVLIPSGRHSFVPNLHTLGNNSIHGFIRQNMTNIGGRAVFDTMRPIQQMQFLQKVNSQFMSSVMKQVSPRVAETLVWMGRTGSQ